MKPFIKRLTLLVLVSTSFSIAQNLPDIDATQGFKGAPYPLPDLPQSVNAPVKPSDEALKLDEPIIEETLPPPPVETAPVAEAVSKEEAPASMITPELINFLKKAVHDEQQSLRGLQSDIGNLRNELKNIRKEEEAKKQAAKKEGLPDTVTLALEFPSKKKREQSVEGVSPTTETSSEAKEGEKPEGKPKPPPPMVMQIKPIPVIYAQEDARADIANAVENVLKTQQEEADIVETEMMQEAKDPNIPNAEKLRDLQKRIDVLASKEAYFKEDANAANDELTLESREPGMISRH